MLDKYIPKDIEEKNYKIWLDKNYFYADVNSDKPSFSIVIPPPNVTGSLHMGHALNNTLQDILSRYKRAKGFNVLWLPGCDHAGIATQNVVERELKKEGKKKEDLGREKFLERVWAWKEKYGSTIMHQLKRLGSSLDWSRERFTMDEGLSNAVKEVFIRLYNEGLIYRGNYIINWCPRCLTAISDIEVIHKEIKGNLYYIKYPFADNPEKFIEVATTRPETMLGDTAVAVNPDDERYKNIKEGTLLILPETGRKIPIIKDKYVDMKFGTGAVKITPAHDPNDFEIGRNHNLEIINVMDKNATMNENAGLNSKYKGLDRFTARKQIVEELKKQNLLTKIEEHKHAVGHCYRCDTIVEPYVSTQWFVKIKPLARPAIQVVKDGGVKFIPQMWEKIYYDWMENIKDWCISRQLWWGHRIPAYYCQDCGEINVAKEKPVSCKKCQSKNLKQDEDVLDTWFSSALWPFSTLGWPDDTKELKVFYPTTVLVTSWDILFFWVARMIMMGMKFMGKQPFYYVVINSLVCDAEGKKMSKSRGNVVDPLDLLDIYSADSLRFTLTTLETQSRHIAFNEERLKGYHNFMNKIWNASKFVINNLDEKISYNDIEINNLKLPEKWILTRLNNIIKKVENGYENYKFSEVALTLYEFFWHEFCDWYIEISKIELKKESDYKKTVKKVLAKVLKEILLLMHPVIPFITEEIYNDLPLVEKKESIMLEKFPETENKFVFDETEIKNMEFLQQIIYTIRNLRAELEFSPGDRIDVAIVLVKQKELLNEHSEIIKTLAKIDNILDNHNENFISREIKINDENAGIVAINKSIIKNLQKLIINKEKQQNNLLNGIKKIETKLNDKNFSNNAPKKLIEEENMKLQNLKQELKKLEELINILKRGYHD